MDENLLSEIEVDEKIATELGLNLDEYHTILKLLGRKPTYSELGMFAVMWSEHCSYKNSIKLLKTLPRTGPQLLVSAGEENAGAVDIGDGYAICFKIESHNHPSAVEPFQGASTGVGGILRDIFSMGSRPIAVLDSLRFGNPNLKKTKFFVRGIVSGISHYGNSFGVPTIGGEVFFEDCYNDNPLVNVMAVGIVRSDSIAFARARGVGNPVFIVGSSTGRDGIHGASLLASKEFDQKNEDMRPTVQVGDPFAEKLLLEATLELIASGVVIGVQDMGAAGITCSTSEMSARGSHGMVINLDKVPLREPGMTPYEILLSESQERMLFVIDKDKVDKAIQICNKWDVPISQIGEVTADGYLQVFHASQKICNVPASYFVLGGEAPQYDRVAKEPEYIFQLRSFDFSNLNLEKINLQDAFLTLLSSPNIVSKNWVFEQYDHQVQTNTIKVTADASVLRLKEIPGKAIALTTDCNSRYVYLNPYRGAVIAVAEAARNLACVGAKPLAITNCLNFGNPYNPEVYWTFKQAVFGIGDACRYFNTPVTGGNVSFHNESPNYVIFPTPIIGMLGLIDNVENICTLEFKYPGDIVYLIGRERNELGGSEFIKRYYNLVVGDAPYIDLDEELKLQNLLLDAISHKVINSAHDISEGGLAIALAEKSVHSQNLGIRCNDNLAPSVIELFSESQTRVLVSVSPQNQNELLNLISKYNLPIKEIGKVIEGLFIVPGAIHLSVRDLKDIYFNTFEQIIK